MEQIATAIAEMQAQISTLSATVANHETMREQLGEIGLPGLAMRVKELLTMREQLGTDLPELVNTVRQLQANQERNRSGRFGESSDRWKKPVNEQKEKMLSLPELSGPESWAPFRNRLKLILDGRWDFAGQWITKMSSLTSSPSTFGHCDTFSTYLQITRDEYMGLCKDVWLILATKASGTSLNIVNAQYHNTTGGKTGCVGLEHGTSLQWLHQVALMIDVLC